MEDFQFRHIEKFDTSIVKARQPDDLQAYINSALDKLEQHYDDPNRHPNFGLGRFSSAVSPNSGSSQRLEWMLKHSGLVDSSQIGVNGIVRARLTTLGATRILDAYNEVKLGRSAESRVLPTLLEEQESKNEQDTMQPEKKSLDGPDAYWTLYTFFTSSDAVNLYFRASDILEYLSEGYDISTETEESILDMLRGWTDDVAEDALQNGIIGTLDFHGNLCGFKTQIKSASLNSSATLTAEAVSVPREAVADRIVTGLETITNQRELREEILRSDDSLTLDAIQLEINNLVDQGKLYRKRVGREVYLSRNPVGGINENGEMYSEVEPLNIDLAASILSALTASGTRYHNETITMKQLWRAIQGIDNKSHSVSEDDIEELKKTSRRLQRASVVVGENKNGYRIGLGSKQFRYNISSMIDNAELRTYLQNIAETNL